MAAIDKETLTLIHETAVKAAGARLLDIGGDGRTARIDQAGQITTVPVPPAPRRHLVATLDDLILYARNRASQAEIGEVPEHRPVVWYGERGVILVLDDCDRRDTVSFLLTFSRRFAALLAMDAGERKSYRQPDFIRLLRMDLGVDAPTVNAFRRLNWSGENRTRGDVQRGSERLGREVLAEVQGVDELPEEFTVYLPLYDQPGERAEYRITLAVEIDPVNQVFQVAPKQGETLAALASHQESIYERLELALQPEESEKDDSPVMPYVRIYGGDPCLQPVASAAAK